jgi:hypothetical protein
VADCAINNNECRTATTCKGGVCGYTYIANNTPAGNQTTGDCQTRVCDGNGNITSIATPTDTPTAQNDCYTAMCDGGSAVQTPKGSGASCNGGKCDGNGHCVAECATGEDCPGTDNDCQTRTCTDGICGMTYQLPGTPTPNQTLGDCKTQICDGAGTIVSITDADDRPAAQGECYFAICTGSTPGQRAKIQGTRCTRGQCDGNGSCVECFTESDCPPSTSVCQTTVCASGTCGFSNASAGTLLVQQTPSDCRIEVCDGNGGITSQYADDPPAGDGVCLPSYTCDNGTALPQYASTDTTCTGGWCDGFGNCVTCNVNEQCPPGPGSSTPLCTDGHTCSYTCTPGFGACPGGPDCSVNFKSDVNNCGTCGHVCNLSNTATATCNNGVCLVAACNAGYGDCDGNPTNGCEIDLRVDPNHCGACGIRCAAGEGCLNSVCTPLQQPD